jgi:uncharacterized protein (DUF58 family)
MQTAELLRKVRRLEIRSRHLVEDLFTGQTESIFKGRGVEFEEVRRYVPGDEVRDIDWNVSARMGEPYVKRFVEEHELSVMLVVDVSRSMRFGTAGQEKRELAAELCAVLGFAALQHNGRIGLLLAGEQVEHFVPPARGRTHLLRLLRDVLDAAPERPGTRLGEATRFLMRTTRRRQVMFWISDFEDRIESREWSVLSRRHDLTAIALRDPRDETLPALGWIELEDLESGARELIDSGSARVRERYRRDAITRQRTAEKALASARCGFVELRTDRTYLPALMRYFNGRRRGRLR